MSLYTRSFTVVIPPASEPLTLSETKLFLRVDGATDDTLITDLITAARQMAEQHLHRSLITQTLKLSLDNSLPERVRLPHGPVQSLSSIIMFARDGSQTVLDPENYYLAAEKELLHVCVPVLGHRIEITYVAGYGAVSDIPESIRQGMLLHIAALYDREAVAGAIPEATANLYYPFREVRL